jgi:O-methyltransferase
MRFIQQQIGDIRKGGLPKLAKKIRRLPTWLNITISRPWISWRDKRIQIEVERILHNENFLWYTLSPMLLTAIAKAFDIQNSNQPGKGLLEGHGYYEFGMFRGFSFWFAEWISREHTGQDFRFYGFDSFEGLPESEVDRNWKKGNYAAPLEFVTGMLKRHGTDFSRVKLYKGFFSKQLFESLRQTEVFSPCAIGVIDCDLYESTVEVLDFIKDYLVPGSILIFDDYADIDDTHGEKRAFLEFEQKNPKFQKEHLFDYGGHGTAFRVIAV